MTEQQEWNAICLDEWRKAWIMLINNMSAGALNGMFCYLDGSASGIVAVIAKYDLENCAEEVGLNPNEMFSAEHFREAWNKFSDTTKKRLLNSSCTSPIITENSLLEMDDQFTKCMNNDKKFAEKMEFEEDED